jgi:hypothetical protein
MTRHLGAAAVCLAVTAVAGAQQWPASWTTTQRPLHVCGNVNDV